MKNLRFGLLAAIIAVGMSSFSESKAKFATYYYQVGSGWGTYVTSTNPCDPGTIPDCKVNINGVQRKLYLAQDTEQPFKRL